MIVESHRVLSPPVRAAVARLVQDFAAADVIRALARAGIPAVVLKGAALFDWYPDGATRTYVDSDLWIPPHAQPEAVMILGELGFTHLAGQVDPLNLPAWFANHATTWLRARDGGEIDLHRRLQFVNRAAEAVWTLLWPGAEAFTVAGEQARRLGVPARALYVVLHAAGHGSGCTHAQDHLRAALNVVDLAGWQAAAALAHELRAVDMFSTGLRLTPEGAAMARKLGLPMASSVNAALYTLTPPPIAFGFEQLASASRLARVRLLLWKFFPPPGFIRHWWPPAARSRRMLLVGYLYRPIWILRRAPAGFRAWRAARHLVEHQRQSAGG